MFDKSYTHCQFWVSDNWLTFSLTTAVIFLLFCMPGNFLLDSGHLTFTFQVLDVLFSYKYYWALFYVAVILLGKSRSFWVLLLRFVRRDQSSAWFGIIISMTEWRHLPYELWGFLVWWDRHYSWSCWELCTVPSGPGGLSSPQSWVVSSHSVLISPLLNAPWGPPAGIRGSPLCDALSSHALCPVNHCCCVPLDAQFCLQLRASPECFPDSPS